MSSPCQSNDAVGVAKPQYPAELVRRHAAFEAMADAGAAQVACSEPLDEAERVAPACELGVQGAAIERMSPLGYEQKSSEIKTYTIEMAVQDFLGLARESDGPSERCSSLPSFESRLGFGLRSLDISGTEFGYLGDETSRSIEQRKRRIVSNHSRIVRFGVDKPHAIRGAWKSLHLGSDLRRVVIRYSSRVRSERHINFPGARRPERHGCGRNRGPPKIRPHTG